MKFRDFKFPRGKHLYSLISAVTAHRTDKPLQRTLAEGEHSASTTGRFLPKDVLMIEFNPKRKLAHFLVELSNVPGALERSAAIATKHRVNILSGFHHAPSVSDHAFWSFFADLTDAKIAPAELARELKSLPSTVNIRYHVPPNGLLIDNFHFPVRWGGLRAIMIRTESIASIFARVNEIFGDGPAARVVLHEMGEAAGRAIIKDLIAQVGPQVIKDELSNILGLYTCNGWGIFELVHIDLDKKTATVRAQENFECTHYQGRSPTARSHFVRGHIAGWFSELVEGRVEVTETSCVAKGDQFCEFTIEPPSI